MGKAVRLDKFLADSGAGTRTEVKKLIQKGMVQVNGETAKKPELKVDPERDVVEFGGERLGTRAEFVYYLLHKPAGYVSATEDTREKTVLELVPKDGRRNLFPVGRLDKDTEGLLLVTDDGQLAHQLLSPKKHVDKTYFAVTEGKVVPEDIEKIQVGVDIGDEEPALPGKLEILKVWEENPKQEVASGKDCERKNVKGDSETMTDKADNEEYKADVEKSFWRSEILLTIQEGRFHQVKRMMEAVGKKVIYLKRISMGPLTLPDDLPKGQARELTPDELAALRQGK
ncbi:rRNA pseudouridine synthase [Blautia glucerasea]|uniref:pseudouridine synthase n=1 Tax=Blautia glucerasea TaxID=536633 RepID=UPI001D002B38|nr:pseudouridine synthase [Blautia glucerasea]MCB5388582.1 rRNA pseudouridine synthase [Blautia glucerasea]MCB5422917.1 rRNA pseudouridine synthase [Blautia luti]